MPGIPLDWIFREGEVCVLNMLAALYVWNTVVNAGHDPTKLVMRFREVGDGTLAVGFFANETDDFNKPIEGLGFIIPMGFWYTRDDRMPLNWIWAKPPSGYGPPGVGIPVDPIYYKMWEGSPNP